MKRTHRIGLSSLGILVVMVGLGYVFRWELLKLLRTVDDPVQHEFVEAARRGDITTMAAMLEKGAQVDDWATYENGAVHTYPALGQAITKLHPEAVQWLLDHGADVNQVYGTDTPLEFAESMLEDPVSRIRAREIIAMLRAAGAKSLNDLNQPKERPR